MGSIEGVIILSSTNEPILHSHFVHPLTNYPVLHTDQLVAQLEAANAATDSVLPPVLFTDGIPAIVDDDDDEGITDDSASEEDEDANGRRSQSASSSEVPKAAKTSKILNGQAGAALVHIEHNRLRFVATFSTQVDPLLPLSFLRAFLGNLELYLGSPLTEDAIRENFDVVYQLLEEMLDESGQPVNTEYNTLRELVREPSWLDSIVGKMGSAVSGISNTALGNAMSQPHISPIPWRRPPNTSGRSTRNEMYIDVVEVLSGVYSRSAHPRPVGPIGLRCQLEGQCRLSGTPDLLLRLSDVRRILDASLHPCVRLRQWKKDHVLSFIPPEGKFRLADFQLESVSALERHVPVSLHCVRHERVSGSKDGLSTFQITVTCSAAVEDVAVIFGLQDRTCTLETTITGGSRPGVVASEDVNALKGTFHFDAKRGAARWAIGKLTQDQRSLELRGTIRGDASNSAALPGLSNCVTCRFAIPQRSLSGVKVASLEIVNEVGYKPFKGVRSMVKGDMDWRW